MNAFLQWLWMTNLAGTAAIVLILLFLPLLRKFLGAQAAFPAWAFALAILLLPWPVRSPASILPAASDLPPIIVRVVVPAGHSTPAAPRPSTPSRETFPLLFAIWATGASVCVIVALLRTLRTHRLVRGSKDITPQLQAFLDTLGGLPPRSRIHESPEIRSPAMCGVFRPVILLPLEWAAGADLRWILLHEIGHIRRGDLLWRWAFQIARAISWFNPLVWVAERTARTDQEMACDEWVLAQGNEKSGVAYGEAILRACRAPSRATFLQAGMAESNAGLGRRIRHLATAHPRGFGALAVTLALGTIAVLLLSPGTPVQNAPESPVVPDPPAPAPAASKSNADAPTQVEIESRFLEISPQFAEKIFGGETPAAQLILNKDQIHELFLRLQEDQSVDLMSAPKVTTQSGRKAIVRIVREFPYPTQFFPPQERKAGNAENSPSLRIPATPRAFETRNVGIEMEVEPNITTYNRVICSLTPGVVEFLGFVNYAGGPPEHTENAGDAIDAAMLPVSHTSDTINQPVFRTRKIQTTVLLRSGETVMLGGLSRIDKQAMEARSGFPAGFPPAQGTKEIERVLYVFVTATLMDSQGIAVSAAEAAAAPPHHPKPRIPEAVNDSTPPPAAPISSNGRPPYGTPVPNKPGFVTSPHAPTAGYVDLRGFSPGTEVKCPYTGKMFLAP